MNEIADFALVFVANGLGFILLALAMPKHLSQVVARAMLPQKRIRTIRGAGFCAIGGGLMLAVASQGSNFGSVMWVLALTLSAATVAFTLTWRPQWLRPLVHMIRP